MATLIQRFADQALLCGEGPVWDTVSGRLYWADCGGEAIYAKGFDAEVPERVLDSYHAASLALHESGGIVFGGRDGFFHWNKGSVPRLVCNHCGEASVVDINDIIADPRGRVFGGQEAFREGEDYDTGYLFRIDLDGSCVIMEEGLHLSNGMGFSPSCDQFYLVDTVLRVIYVYDYDIESGNIKNKRVLIKLKKDEGLPDGMTVDREGFLWVAKWFGGGLSRYDPTGKLERTIDLPVAQISSLTFGGPFWKDIFVTSAAQYWETPLAPIGHDFSSSRGGSVYRIAQDIEGKPEYIARI
ncbi:SMP-30/gluconolactonase/LRE family protein [Parapedobacter sp. 2B3]|uniref:SMP-30/gluconolactonase/LRE family protein n=1 Tax=Parapedobacter sp. 2B3 TaxID=3342381 RepID=UPI0035B68B7A